MDASRWYWNRNGKKVGPLSSGQLKQLAAKGQLRPDDLVLQEGARQWVQADSINGLFTPATPERRPLWPWMAACTAAALLGGVGTAVLLNSGKREDEKPDPVALKPADSDPGTSGKNDKKPEEKKPEEKKPEEKKPEEKKPEADKKPPERPAPETAETLRLAEFQRFLKAGRVLLDANQFDAAAEAFTKAVNLDPDSKEAIAGLKAARDARTAELAKDRDKRDEEQKQRTYRLLMENGQANVKRKQFDLAILAFDEALKVKPDDEDARAALLAAEKAKKAAVVAAVPPVKPAPMRDPNLDTYRLRMAEGRTALFVTGQFDAAVAAFNEALKLFPNDLVAAAFLAEAQKTRDAAAILLIAQAQLIQQELWRGVTLNVALTQGRTALVNGNLDLAASAFNYAFQLAPNDPAVIQARLDLQQAQNTILAQEGYQRFLRNGQQALRDRRYNDAVNAYTQAVTLAPFDQPTRDLLREAIRLRNDARTAANVAQQTTAQVKQLLGTGQAALGRNDLNGASASFSAAQQLAPNDPGVIQALQDLAAARNTAQAGTDRQKLLASYQQLMKAGQDAQAGKRYQEAIRSFGEAARLVRGDKDSVNLLLDADRAKSDAEKALKAQTTQTQDDTKRTAHLHDLLRKGRTALANFHFDSASKTLAEAKNLAPNDADVQKALQEQEQARAHALKFDLRIEPGQVKLIPGMFAQVKLTVDRKGTTGFQGPVDFELRNLPLGVTASRGTIPAGQTSVVIQLSAVPGTGLGTRSDVVGQGTVRGITGQVTSPAFAIVIQRK